MNLQKLQADPAAFWRSVRVPTPTGPRFMGTVAADFQLSDWAALVPAMHELSGLDPGGRVYRRAWLERTKGASKDTDMALVVLWLTAFSRRALTVHVGAVDRDQARLIGEAAHRIIAANEWLTPLIDVQANRLVCPHTRSAVEILTSDTASAHGGRPDALLLNELGHFPSRDFADALLSNAAKNPRGLVVVATNAGWRDHFAWTLRREAESSDRWYFHTVPEPAPWISRDDVAEQERLLPPQMFSRLWRGEWSDSCGDALDAADVDRSVVLDSPSGPVHGAAHVAGVDLGLRRDATAVAVLAKQRDGTMRLCAMRSWTPGKGGRVSVDEVEEELLRLHGRYRFQAVGVDVWQAEQLCERLAKRGVPVSRVPFTASNTQAMAQCMIEAFREGTLHLYSDAALLRELRAMRLKETSRGYRLDMVRDASGHGDRATAVALGLLASRDVRPPMDTAQFLRFHERTSSEACEAGIRRMQAALADDDRETFHDLFSQGR